MKNNMICVPVKDIIRTFEVHHPEMVFLDKNTIARNPMAKVDYDIESVMRVIDGK